MPEEDTKPAEGGGEKSGQEKNKNTQTDNTPKDEDIPAIFFGEGEKPEPKEDPDKAKDAKNAKDEDDKKTNLLGEAHGKDLDKLVELYKLDSKLGEKFKNFANNILAQEQKGADERNAKALAQQSDAWKLSLIHIPSPRD